MNSMQSRGNLCLGAVLVTGTLVSGNALSAEMHMDHVAIGDMSSTSRQCGNCALNEKDIASWSFSSPIGRPIETRVADNAFVGTRESEHGRAVSGDARHHGIPGHVVSAIFGSEHGGRSTPSTPTAAAAPEIDATLWGSGLTLLLGGLAVLTGIKRSRP